MTYYKQGDLVFLNFPFDDTAVSKPRPCIIVGDKPSKFGAYIVAKITSNPRNDAHSFWLDNNELSLRRRGFHKFGLMTFRP